MNAANHEVGIAIAGGFPPQAAWECTGDNGRCNRSGTIQTAIAHIMTRLIGYGVLLLPWAMAQLGWVAGPLTLLFFSVITYYGTSYILATLYHSGNCVSGRPNSMSVEAVEKALGGFHAKIYVFSQYSNLVGVAIGNTYRASASITAMKRLSCKGCVNQNPSGVIPFMLIFGGVEILISQIPDFDGNSWLSKVAAAISFVYPTIGLGFAISKVVENGKFKGSLAGIFSIQKVTDSQKIWKIFQAIGYIAFAYTYPLKLDEFNDTIESLPEEYKTMKIATLIGMATTTIYYMFYACIGFAAFGDMTPENLLTSFGSHNLKWLLYVANVAIVIHLLWSFQVYCRPFFAFIENMATKNYLKTKSININISKSIDAFWPYELNLFRLVWRTVFVCMITFVVMVIPFLKDIVRAILSINFWSLTVYFPVEMYIVNKKIPKWSTQWVSLQVMSAACFIILMGAAIASVAKMVHDQETFKPFKIG